MMRVPNRLNFLPLLFLWMQFSPQCWAATFLRGDFNGWGTTPLTVDGTFGAGLYSSVTITGVAAASSAYKFFSDGTAFWYGAGVTALPDSLMGLADKDGQGDLSWNATASRHYTFRIKGFDDWWQRSYVVMSTDAAPVSFIAVADDHASGDSALVTVTITTSAVPSAGENVYVRWTADGFSTSDLVQTSGNGTQWNAVLPVQPPGTVVTYYVFSSTMPSAIVASNPDLCTLRGANNGGANYSYTARTALRVSKDDGLSWVDADYTTSKFFIDERAGERRKIIIHYSPGVQGVSSVEVFTNLDRRDLADVDYSSSLISADGYADGIAPPDGNLITSADTGAYFTAFPMSDAGGGVYAWTGTVSRCGAYRLTARYRAPGQGGTQWTWYGDDALRDHAVVVSPAKVHDLVLYELNALTVNATSSTESGRSTFADLSTSSNGRFSLGYMDAIHANCLWFQPVHPSATTTRGDPSGYSPGSPYATRDYFAIDRWFGSGGTEDSAMTEFTNFVALCDHHTGAVGSVHIMLDGVFNHTSWDAEFGQGGVDLGLCADADQLIGYSRPGWYSLITDYGAPATYYNSDYDNDFATAPDRGDFGKWNDVAELFFGNYAALVRHNPEDNGNYLNEEDWYDYAGMSVHTKELWRYFAFYADYWLAKTGHPGTNAGDGTQDDLGIDGLRCDFGQGLPPQFWEYFINHTRSRKWNFIFMAETLDGGKPGYRSNRHFDILNENIVFAFKTIDEPHEFRLAYENRRDAYDGGAILLNLTGHDEEMPFADPWMTASRHGCNAMIDGLPMVFYGQEHGIVPATGTTGGINQGFELFEYNFGKYIPHFKQWNKATFWEQPPAFSDGLTAWYGRVNRARLSSPALRSMNRYFLSRSAGGDNPGILAAAKYERYGAGPSAENDVVLAFALILDASHTPANDTFDLKGAWDALGLEFDKRYNVRDIAAADPLRFVWSTPRSGRELYDEGVWVDLPADSTGAITADGALVQFLRLVPVNSGSVLMVR